LVNEDDVAGFCAESGETIAKDFPIFECGDISELFWSDYTNSTENVLSDLLVFDDG
jgi:hypothetical protein